MGKSRKKSSPVAKSPKGELLQVRLDDDEKVSFQEAASVNGLALSAWVRERLRKAAIADLAAINREPGFLTDKKAKTN